MSERRWKVVLELKLTIFHGVLVIALKICLKGVKLYIHLKVNDSVNLKQFKRDQNKENIKNWRNNKLNGQCVHACSKLAQQEYKRKHGNMARYVH